MPGAGGMDGPGDQFFAGPGFPQNEHRGVGRPDLRDLMLNLPKREALTDESAVLMQGLQFLPQQFRLRRQRFDLLLRFHPVMDVAQDQGGIFLPMELKSRDRRLGGKRFAFRTTSGEAPGIQRDC